MPPRPQEPAPVNDNHPNLAAPLEPGASLPATTGPLTLLARVHVSDASEVWRAVDEYGSQRAVKFDRPTGLEAGTATKLARRLEHVAGIVRVHVVEDQMLARVTVMDWVEGKPLSDVLRRRQLSRWDIVALLSSIASAIAEVAQLGLVHGDVHTGNVLVAPGRLPRGSVTLIDLARLQERPADRARHLDHRGFATIACELHNHLRRSIPHGRADEVFLDNSEEIIRQAVETAPARARPDPTTIAAMYEASLLPVEPEPSGLRDPFEYPRAERIPDPETINELFAGSNIWGSELQVKDSRLVVGPRGSGKSMLLRWLSLEAHVHRAISPSVVGVYMNCDGRLSSKLSAVVSRDTVVSRRSTITAIAVLEVVISILHTLDSVGGGGPQNLSAPEQIRSWLSTRLGLSAPVGIGKRPYAHLAADLDYISSLLDLDLQSVTPNNTDIPRLLATVTMPFLDSFIELVQASVPEFHRRTIVLLLDNYSLRHLSEPALEFLNTLVFRPNARYLAAVATEPENYTTALVGEGEISARRDYRLLRGTVELAYSREKRTLEGFVQELIDARLRRASYAGTAVELLGSDRGELSLAEALVSSDSARETAYHGIERLSHVCAGEASLLLDILSRMFDQGDVGPTDREQIPAEIQHEAIGTASKEQLNLLHRAGDYGPKLHSIADAFGSFARQVLLHIRDGRGRPVQIPRMEFNGLVHTLNLQSTERRIYGELLRHGVFLELPISRGQRTGLPITRLAFRRVLLPVFRASVYKTQSLRVPLSFLPEFLADPAAALGSQLASLRQRALQRESEPQLALFDASDASGLKEPN